MENVSTLLESLQTVSVDHPVGFALIVILVMITEGLIVVALMEILLKRVFRSDTRTGRSR